MQYTDPVTSPGSGSGADDTPRRIADSYVETLSDLNPITATYLGNRPGSDALPDLSPDGHDAIADAQRATLAALDAAEATAGGQDALPAVERRAARLLRERLDAELALHGAGEHLREVSNLFSPVHQLRAVFLMMPAETDEDWAVIGRRMRRLPQAVQGYVASLDAGLARGLPAASRQVETMAGQFDDWLTADWFRGFVAAGPEAQRAELYDAAAQATRAFDELRVYRGCR
jgi:uncharacterized protein (DUF885 family)